MSESPKGRSSTKRRWIWLGLAVPFLPILYVLSAGPGVYLMGRGVVSEETLDAAYYPIKFVAENGFFDRWGVDGTLEHYFHWWDTKGKEAKARAEKVKAR